VNQDPYQHISDAGILENFYADRNNQWLGILLQRYTLMLFGVCMKYLKNEEEAKDSVQQIFLKAITELHKYRVEYFKSWIYSVARNHCLMLLREKGRFVQEIDESMGMTEEELNNKSTLLEKDRTLNYIALSLQELNEDQRKCIQLFYLEKRSYQYIAENTGYTLMQVKSHIQNGKRNLKIMVEKKMKES
jgi:RNA polymerase sigma factor (sigma-70 family)